METRNEQSGSLNLDQLKKYARDLAEVYVSAKQKSKELHIANQQLLKYADDFNLIILDLKSSHQELKEAYLDTIYRLVLAAEYKDEDTGDHIVRMSRYCALIAERLGLPAEEVQNILYASPMHDVGKIGIPDNILMKPGKLTDREFEIMKTHTTIGAKLLANSKDKILQIAHEIAISHHEKWNGEGYPRGLVGKEIPLVGRIVGLADVFDALTSRRPYKDPYPVDVALDIINKERGKQFDPDMADLFLENMDEILTIKENVGLKQDLWLAGFAKSKPPSKQGDPVNLRELAQNLGLEEEEYLELIKPFIETGMSDLYELESAIEQENAQNAANAAHSLKDAARNLGLVEVSETAREIEEKARDDRLEGSAESAGVLREKLDAIADLARG